MARDPLPVLLRLRSIALDAARRSLAGRMRDAATASAQAAQLDATVAAETSVHAGQAAENRLPDAFVAWRGRMQRAQRQASEAVAASTAAIAEAQAAVNEARVAVRALEAAAAHQAAQRRSATARTEQRALDEAAAAGIRQTAPDDTVASRVRPKDLWSG